MYCLGLALIHLHPCGTINPGSRKYFLANHIFEACGGSKLKWHYLGGLEDDCDMPAVILWAMMILP